MADILCPNCKKNNPDFLDRCQFCQTPLKPEAMVQIGQKPTKKGTGELENALPDWLKDARQQSRDSATDDDAVQSVTQSKVQKNEAPDLLAGLASQAGRADEEDVPDWLANMNPVAKPKPLAPSSPEPEKDFFAQFNKTESEPVAPPSQSAQEDVPSQPSGDKDELSAWFSQASEQPVEPVSFEPGTSQNDMGWMSNLDSARAPAQEPAPKEEEDLSWLHDLEASSKQTADQPAPKQDLGWMANFETPSSSSQPSNAPPDDLSWLNNLGGTPEPAKPAPSTSAPQEDLSWLDTLGGATEPSQPAPSIPPASQEDLSWLSNLGRTEEPSQPTPSLPSAPQEDLGWLNTLGGTAEPSQPAPSLPSASQEDLSWLNTLGTTEPPSPAPAQPYDIFDQDKSSAPQEGLSWLDNLGAESEPLSASKLSESTPISQDEPDWLVNTEEQSSATPASVESLSPRHTAPLSKEAEESMPDWLKSATEEPSMPMGAEGLEQFRDKKHPLVTSPEDAFAWMGSLAETKPAEEEPLPSSGQPATIDASLFAPANDSSSLANKDVDSLLSMEMPDWLSRPDPGEAEVSSQGSALPTTEGGDALSPVDLPSWVQAMRPVEAAVSETVSSEDQPTEREGPLAGLRGLIPIAPIGSARRPKPISLKLQASNEQQAGAVLLDQVLAGETAPRTITASPLVMSQRALRWALSGLFVIVLGVMISLRSQAMPVSPLLPSEVSAASSAIVNLPENSRVLVVVDYEPSLAGELEATSGPLLDQLVLLRHPRLSFLSTSPNGSALVERLMTATNINQPIPNGLGYVAGEHYFNLGYLPGGAAGVLEFVESPQLAMASAGVQRLSEFAAVIVLTDHAESGRVWVEQLGALKQVDPALASQPLLIVSSAQAGPLLQPYVSSRQVTGMVSGLSDAARYEFVNNSRPGIARAYWDAFGVGLMLAIASITIGSLWSLFARFRARRSEAGEG